jgi:hypothetical protein
MDLKSVSSNITVYKLTLQKANTNVINWILNSHRSFDVAWLTNYVDAVCVRLHAGTCNQSLPGLDKTVFEDKDKISLGFQWRPVYDGKNKEQQVKAGLDQTYAIHVICKKKDKSLARALMNCVGLMMFEKTTIGNGSSTLHKNKSCHSPHWRQSA